MSAAGGHQVLERPERLPAPAGLKGDNDPGRERVSSPAIVFSVMLLTFLPKASSDPLRGF